MQIYKEDPTLDALIDRFNQQSAKCNWDACYGTSLAIADHYAMRSKQIQENVAAQLKIGVINRANAAAKEAIEKNRKKGK